MACKPFQKKDAIHRFDAGMVSFFFPPAAYKYRPQATMLRIVDALAGRWPVLCPGGLRPMLSPCAYQSHFRTIPPCSA